MPKLEKVLQCALTHLFTAQEHWCIHMTEIFGRILKPSLPSRRGAGMIPGSMMHYMSAPTPKLGCIMLVPHNM